MNRIIYHGSDKIIEKPILGEGNIHNDYGLGFYCCSSKELADEWASKKDGLKGIVNKYSIRDDDLKILDLTKPPFDNVLQWVAILIHFRKLPGELTLRYPRELKYLEDHYYVDVNQYDIVIGYRADDNYFQFPQALIRSSITIDTLKEIFQLGQLGKQYVLISEKAFSRLKFVESFEAKMSPKDYMNRKKEANEIYQSLLEKDRYSSGTRLIDLVRDK